MLSNQPHRLEEPAVISQETIDLRGQRFREQDRQRVPVRFTVSKDSLPHQFSLVRPLISRNALSPREIRTFPLPVMARFAVVSSHPLDRGFAPNEQVLAERRTAARSLVGQRAVSVAYVNIDYRGWDLGHRDQSTRRTITDQAEWSDTTWDADTFHHLDFGIEFTTDRDETWGITWDSPSDDAESIHLKQGTVSERGAVWDVTAREPWRSCLTSPVSDILLRYHPWSDLAPGFWCTRVSMQFGATSVEVLLGDRDQTAQLSPSADNIAVVWDVASFPEWERVDDLV